MLLEAEGQGERKVEVSSGRSDEEMESAERADATKGIARGEVDSQEGGIYETFVGGQNVSMYAVRLIPVGASESGAEKAQPTYQRGVDSRGEARKRRAGGSFTGLEGDA